MLAIHLPIPLVPLLRLQLKIRPKPIPPARPHFPGILIPTMIPDKPAHKLTLQKPAPKLGPIIQPKRALTLHSTAHPLAIIQPVMVLIEPLSLLPIHLPVAIVVMIWPVLPFALSVFFTMLETALV